MKIILLEEVILSLLDISNYTYLNWGEKQNTIYINSFKEKFETIATYPRHGRFIKQQEGFEVRIALHKKHKIIYHLFKNHILIIRILGQRQG